MYISMAAGGVSVFGGTISVIVHRRHTFPATRKFKQSVILIDRYQQRRQSTPSVSYDGAVEKKSSPSGGGDGGGGAADLNLKDYFEQSRELICRSDGGPPRWFSPLDCGSRLKDSPLMLYLPGIDGVGLGLILHHERLGKIFDVWCLHIPIIDRTSFADLVKQVESTVRLEYACKPNRPIYLVGESFGGCLALAVAALNPDIDLKLILANPATSFRKSQMQLQSLLPLSIMLNEQLYSILPYVLSLLSGSTSRMVAAMRKQFPSQQLIGEASQDIFALLSFLSVRKIHVMHLLLPFLKYYRTFSIFVFWEFCLSLHFGVISRLSNLLIMTILFFLDMSLILFIELLSFSTLFKKVIIKSQGLSDVLTMETIIWKLNMLKSSSAFANSRLHAVKAEVLMLTSGRDNLLPSREEGERLRRVLPKCDIRTFDDCGHALFLEDGINMVSILTGASFYRRGRYRDYVSDYLPPSHSEFQRVYEPYRWIETATDPVMLSTMESGKIVRSLAGIPSEGPVLFVGYHMMLGFELIPLVSRFWTERNILLRGMAHPMMFTKLREGKLPELSAYDTFRIMGAVPVSAPNFYKLFSSKSHVLLYPGGMREALHRKGEEYKLFWPEQSEFVRMAARFGAKIIPFGSVGEDDIGHLLLDYDDLRRIPYFKAAIEDLTDEALALRGDARGEVSNQDVHLPIILPKVPGRFYYLFGKPIETEGRKQELKNRGKADELYLEVKCGVEKCLGYLREKRGTDPYRNMLHRLAYQAVHGFDSEIPTFHF